MKFVKPEAAGENRGHYSPGVISGGTLYISGQLSIDRKTGELPPGGIREQTLQALRNMEEVLSAAGEPLESVVLCRVYITDIEHWGAVNEVFRDFFGSHKPARVVVPVPALHYGCLAEIEAVAECGRVR